MPPVRYDKVIGVTEYGNIGREAVPEYKEIAIRRHHGGQLARKARRVQSRRAGDVVVQKDAELFANDVVPTSGEQDGVGLLAGREPIVRVVQGSDQALLLGDTHLVRGR